MECPGSIVGNGDPVSPHPQWEIEALAATGVTFFILVLINVSVWWVVITRPLIRWMLVWATVQIITLAVAVVLAQIVVQLL